MAGPFGTSNAFMYGGPCAPAWPAVGSKSGDGDTWARTTPRCPPLGFHPPQVASGVCPQPLLHLGWPLWLTRGP